MIEESYVSRDTALMLKETGLSGIRSGGREQRKRVKNRQECLDIGKDFVALRCSKF